MITAAAACLALSGCGGSAASSTGGGPVRTYPVRVSVSGFPGLQRLAQRTHLVLAVVNSGTATIPNVAVTITDPPYGTAAEAFSSLIAAQPGLASRSRPIWIVDRPPGPCLYSCLQGGPGGAVTANSDTWALGALAPGRTATFEWTLTAVQPGHYAVAYSVAGDLRGGAHAVLSGGAPAAGEMRVTISSRPQREHVNSNGQVVYSQ